MTILRNRTERAAALLRAVHREGILGGWFLTVGYLLCFARIAPFDQPRDIPFTYPYWGVVGVATLTAAESLALGILLRPRPVRTFLRRVTGATVVTVFLAIYVNAYTPADLAGYRYVHAGFLRVWAWILLALTGIGWIGYGLSRMKRPESGEGTR